MPVETNVQIASTSFIGLQSYSEAQAASFFGRDKEIDTLTQLVRLNTLTIVFGKSGTGKTSLLNAGVFPLLRKNYCLPFRIRLEFNEDSPDLVTQIKKVLKEQIDADEFKVNSYPSTETLWEYFHREPLWKNVTPILVFDQFEEIFTLAKVNPRFGKDELDKFWEELSDLAENSVPQKLKETFLTNKEKIPYNYKKQKVKIVFAFREEYLPEFETITAKIPSIKTSRFRLLTMNGNQALEVITKTWKKIIQPTEAKKIISYLTNETNKDYWVEQLGEAAVEALEGIVNTTREAGTSAQRIGETAGQQEGAFARLQEQIGHLATVSARIRSETHVLTSQAGRAIDAQQELDGAIRQLEKVSSHLQSIARHFTVGE
jgi:hypothetical protein